MHQLPLTPSSSYDPNFFAKLFAVEDRHFWFRGRNHVIRAIATQIESRLPAHYRALEVGCGTGNVLRHLQSVCKRGQVIGMDLFGEGLHFAKKRVTVPLIQGDIHTPPFAAQFHFIGLFDVIEHLPDDLGVLRDLHEMLLPGGSLLLTVPAHASLWSYFDQASHHYRRYELDDMKIKLQDSSYEIEYLSQYMMSIFPIVWLGRRLARINRNKSTEDLAATELAITPIVNDILSFILSVETALITRRWQLPIGTSLVAIAHKPL